MAYALPPELQGAPDWQVGRGRRLRLAMMLAAVLVLSGLSVIRMPVAGDVVPLLELVVRLIESAAETEVQSERKPGPDTTTPAEQVEEPPLPLEIDESQSTAAEQQDQEETETSEIVPVPLEAVGTERDTLVPIVIQVVEDWREFGTEVVQEFIANLPKSYTVNPVFDEKRRLAAIKFRPSNEPIKRGPWDDVEKDQLGRMILKLGDHCWQVLDDPSGVNREIFETYTQHLVMCTLSFGGRRGKELPWVEEIRSKYPYLLLREQQKRDPNAF